MKVGKHTFFERSNLANQIFLLLFSNSIQAPRVGIIWPEKIDCPDFLSTSSEKKTPADRTIWVTTTRSDPLKIKVPHGVIIGSSPINTVSSLNSPVSLFSKATWTLSERE